VNVNRGAAMMMSEISIRSVENLKQAKFRLPQ